MSFSQAPRPTGPKTINISVRVLDGPPYQLITKTMTKAEYTAEAEYDDDGNVSR